MALTRAAPARTVTGPEGIKCDGHHKPARKFQAGPTSKNPGRWFYTCPLPREDPQRCKFFKWADEVGPEHKPDNGRTLGASPGAPRVGLPTTPSRLMRPTGSALQTPAKAHPHSPAPPVSSASRTPTHPPHPQTPSRKEVVVVSDDEIDWESLDADGLERDAEARATPKSSQSQSQGVQARLEAASPLAAKRKLSDEGEEERTPKRAAGNPFLTTPSRTGDVTTPTSHTSYSHMVSTPGSEVGAGGVQHPALGSVMTALGEVGEHLARQERLVRAAESMKRSMRTTIKNLQERVKTLEAELEAERAKNK